MDTCRECTDKRTDLVDELMMKVWNLEFQKTSLSLSLITRVDVLLQQFNDLHTMPYDLILTNGLTYFTLCLKKTTLMLHSIDSTHINRFR